MAMHRYTQIPRVAIIAPLEALHCFLIQQEITILHLGESLCIQIQLEATTQPQVEILYLAILLVILIMLMAVLH